MAEETKRKDSDEVKKKAQIEGAESENQTKDLIKQETTGNATTEDDARAIEGIKERLKFFFSDANIRQDVFMRKLLMNTDEKSVAVDILLRFNTIKKYTEKASTIISAAKELTDTLVVDEEKMTIGRYSPFTKDMMDQNIPKSIYVKNLPVHESKRYDVTVEALRALFEQHGEIALVKLNFSSNPDNGDYKHYGPSDRQKRRKFPIGTAMIEFQTQEDLEKAAALTLTTKGGEKVKPKDEIILPISETRDSTIQLEVLLLSEHIAMRKEKKKKGEVKKRREREPDEEIEISKFTLDWKPKCVIKLHGLPEGCDREAMLYAIAKGLDISLEEVKTRKIYVDYSRGQKDGAIRFPDQSDDIVKISKKLKNGELMVMDAKVEEAIVLEGEEEKKYWNEFIAFKNKQMIQRAEEKKNNRNNKRQRQDKG
eukprot:CAMPEP_0197184028 /NCGR_PEP_ID=MMETSP1423-20130617/9055_1 /TAXON_ID=476441 /ORGANISM="Pseudo-nitzschia heimii, Strain UNC1101" /LENGTH=424 /DNA_ID=CAMNT_0042634745 /DNA_START=126 /DNA_END=1400 /DNA_ORIENTATION=+